MREHSTVRHEFPLRGPTAVGILEGATRVAGTFGDGMCRARKWRVIARQRPYRAVNVAAVTNFGSMSTGIPVSRSSTVLTSGRTTPRRSIISLALA